MDENSKPEGSAGVPDHHLTARQRQRRGPMWGCLRTLSIVFGAGVVLLLVLIGVVRWYLGTSNFAEFVKLRIETTLEARLGREVHIGSVEVHTRKPQKVILRDIRIANAPGGLAKDFATVKEVVITGGIDSFWGRKISIGRVDINGAQIFFEIFPDGSKLTHNFPQWKSGPKSRFEIVHVDLRQLFLRDSMFSFLDRDHDISAIASGLGVQVDVTRAKDLYAGTATSPKVTVRIQDFVPFDVDLRGGFRFTPGRLELTSVALKGPEVEAYVSGPIAPLSEGRYDLALRGVTDLEHIKKIFKIDNTLDGPIALDGRLAGDSERGFSLTGRWRSAEVAADAYELSDITGTLDITGDRTIVDIASARYGGGNVSAHYLLRNYDDPLPMSIDLRYNRISIEQLFNDWGVEGTGLRAAATGTLKYSWEDDRLLEGSGSGTARLEHNAVAFSKARHPLPLAGATDFALERGVIRFSRGDLDTGATKVAFGGTLRIEDLVSDLTLRVTSTDLGELDRIGYNFAISAGETDYELLGLGGSGTITGTVRGKMEEPVVVAQINATDTMYGNVLLGNADIALRYDGPRSVLTFDRAVFSDGVGQLALEGTISFPKSGPGPRFDIAVRADNYPVQRAIDAVGLDLKVGAGRGTGSLVVTGTPENGTARFAGLTIREGESTLQMNGTIAWLPGEGNVSFDLDIAAENFPVNDVIAFLDLGEMPVTGALTGTLHIEGPKNTLQGAGTVTVRNGSVFGEPVDIASAELVFDQGSVRATNFEARGAAGELRGEASYAFESERFSYNITSAGIDLSKVKALSSLANVLGGKLTISSQGAGSLESPELVVDATLHEGTIRGLNLPAGAPPPRLYVAIRNGELIIRGSAADLFTIEGNGTVGPDMAVNGTVRIAVPDIAKLLAISPRTNTIPAAGSTTIDLVLGGNLAPIEALRVEGSISQLALTISGHSFSAPRPQRFLVADGKLSFIDFELTGPATTLVVTGSANLTGNQALDLAIGGSVEAEILQLLVPGLRASGRVEIAASIIGTATDPQLAGSADVIAGQFRFPGFPQLIDDVNGTFVFRGDQIDVEALRATIGGGRVAIGGTIAFDGTALDRVRLAIQGEDVALRVYEGVSVEGDFNLLLNGNLERMVLQGDLNVDRALYFRDIDFRQSILNLLLARRSSVVPTVAAGWQDRIDLRLRVNANNTLAVRNNIADVTGSAALEVTGTLANPVILGEVTFNQGGTVTFQNIEYRVARGRIDFQNPFRIDPYFDITLEGRVSGNVSEIESGPIDLTVNITGTIDRITPTITSDPPTSDITLFSLIGLGGLSTTNGGTGGAAPALVGQSLLYRGLTSFVGSRVLPFADSFTYDPGLIDTGSGAGPKVTFEKRVSNTIRVLVVYNLDSHESREVIEWLVNRNWTLQVTRDETANEYRLDARFRRRFNGYWTLGGKEREFEDAGTFDAIADAPARSAQPRRESDRGEAPVPPPSGPRVLSVSFRADTEFDTTVLEELVRVRANEPLSVRDVQSSIKSLFATGHFRDVRVEATEQPDGVNVTFALFLNYRVRQIEVEGLGERERSRAASEIIVRTGDVLSLNAVDRSATALQTRLQRSGYLEATVDPEVIFERERNTAAVVLHVSPGPLARVGRVAISGEIAPFTESALIDQIEAKPGSTFRLNELRNDAERMQRFLVRKDHRRANVTYEGYEYDLEAKLVTVRFTVKVGPLVKIAVRGASERAMRRLIGIRGDQEYSADEVDRAADRIVDHFQERGYFFVAVDTESNLENGVWTTTFIVVPGDRYTVGGVDFAGNQLIADRELQGVVQTSRGGFRESIARLFRRPTGVTSTQLSDDRDALESYYRMNGFSEVTVGDPVVTRNEAEKTLAVAFAVTEGPQTLLADVAVEGVEQVGVDELPRLALDRGEPLNPALLHDDLVALQTFYAERGNVEVQVTPRVELSDDKTSAKVAYVIAEGPQVRIGQVSVRGNTYTNTELVERKADVDSGDPFTYSELLESQRNLYRLGTFRRVDVQSEQSGTGVDERDVVIEVEEGQNLTISGAIGAVYKNAAGSDSQISPRVAAAMSHRNLFGTGRSVGVEAVLSSLEREAYFTYREPYIGKYDIPLQFTLFQTDDSTRKETRIQQRGMSLEASRVEGLSTRWSLRYEYKISECQEGDVCGLIANEIPVPGLDRSLLNIRISSLTPTIFWDKRNDVVNPTRGFFTSASAEYAFPVLDADSHFLKEFVQGAWYLPVSRNSVLALSGRLGFIQAFETNGENGPSRFVPLSERFTAGGETSHRAFPLDLLGDLCEDDDGFTIIGCEPTLFRLVDADKPDDKGSIVPLGGNAMALFNLEYRFPIFSSVGGAVFTDIGNVYAKQIKLDDLRYGVGVGLRYISPVGPIRFDIGWPIERRAYEPAFSYFVTLGYAF